MLPKEGTYGLKSHRFCRDLHRYSNQMKEKKIKIECKICTKTYILFVKKGTIFWNLIFFKKPVNGEP